MSILTPIITVGLLVLAFILGLTGVLIGMIAAILLVIVLLLWRGCFPSAGLMLVACFLVLWGSTIEYLGLFVIMLGCLMVVVALSLLMPKDPPDQNSGVIS